jgi:TetR/AcrR family transcriptional regulator
MPDTNATPAQRRRLSHEGRREQLVDIASRLFSLHGFKGTTTREVARAAGVTEPVIFQHFPHKDDLYAAILERKSGEACTDTWVAQLRAAAKAGDDRAVVRAIVEQILEYQRQNPEFLRLMLYSALEAHGLARQFDDRHFAPIREFLIDYVAAAQRAGRIRHGDPRTIVFFIVAVPAHHGIVQILKPGLYGPSAPDLVDTYTQMILEGIRTTPSASPHGAATPSHVRASE